MYIYDKDCVFSCLDDIRGKKITVMGLGLNGGGLASVLFFLRHGAFVTVTDMKTAEQLSASIIKIDEDIKKNGLDKNCLTYVLGEHRIQDFENSDCVIKNPGVKIEGNKYLAAAKAIETDISIFLSFTKSPIIAVTGSKGKSSTVSAIHYGLQNSGFKSFLGGNITVSPLTFLEETDENTPVVLELSSWQLSDLRGRSCFHPKISVITKIVPDHQNWYGNMESYVADKQLIYQNQTENDYTIVDFDDDEEGSEPKNAKTWGDLFASQTKAKVLRYTKRDFLNKEKENGVPKDFAGVFQTKDKNGNFEGVLTFPFVQPAIEKLPLCQNNLEIENLSSERSFIPIMRELSVPGEHMKINVLNSALVLFLMGVEPKKIIDVMSKWQGVEHRLQFFHQYGNIKFYNDSCATVPEAAVQAANSFGVPVILLAGGTDKGLSLKPLSDLLCKKEKNAIYPEKIFLLDGSATKILKKDLDKFNIPYNGPYDNLKDMLVSLKQQLFSSSVVERVPFNQNNTESKNLEDSSIGLQSSFAGCKIVVFSPGATSFEKFTNEFDRGNKFMALTKEVFS